MLTQKMLLPFAISTPKIIVESGGGPAGDAETRTSAMHLLLWEQTKDCI